MMEAVEELIPVMEVEAAATVLTSTTIKTETKTDENKLFCRF
jgi:hypothetical protein